MTDLKQAAEKIVRTVHVCEAQSAGSSGCHIADWHRGKVDEVEKELSDLVREAEEDSDEEWGLITEKAVKEARAAAFREAAEEVRKWTVWTPPHVEMLAKRFESKASDINKESK